jgi:hypothetical protein
MLSTLIAQTDSRVRSRKGRRRFQGWGWWLTVFGLHPRRRRRRGLHRGKGAMQPSPPEGGKPAAAAAEAAARQAREAEEARARRRAGRPRVPPRGPGRRACGAARRRSGGGIAGRDPRPRSPALPSASSAWLGLGLTGFAQTDLAIRQSSQDQLNHRGRRSTRSFPGPAGQLRDRRSLVVAGRRIDGNTINGPTACHHDAEASPKWPPEKGTRCRSPWAPSACSSFGEPSERSRTAFPSSDRPPSGALVSGEYDVGSRLQGLAVCPLRARCRTGRSASAAICVARSERRADIAGRVGIDTPIADGLGPGLPRV